MTNLQESKRPQLPTNRPVVVAETSKAASSVCGVYETCLVIHPVGRLKLGPNQTHVKMVYASAPK